MARTRCISFHVGIDPVHFGLDYNSPRRNGQSREPARELRPHQPSIRDRGGRRFGYVAACLPRHGTYERNHSTYVWRTWLCAYAAAELSPAAGAMASGDFEVQGEH